MLKIIKEKLNSGMGRDVIWTFSLQITIMLCSFIITKILSNRLSIDDFGQYNLIKRSVQVLSFVMLAGVGIALPRYIPLYHKSDERKPITPLISASFIYILGVSFAVILLCWVLRSEIQQFLLGQACNTQLYIIAIAYAFILAMAQFTYAYYRGIGNFKWYNGAQLGVQLAIILPLILLSHLTSTNVFASWLVITMLLVIFYLVRELWLKNGAKNQLTTQEKPRKSTSMRSVANELKTIIKYSSGRLLADFFLFSLSAFPLIYISNTQGLQSTAYFSVGITFVTMATPIFSFMGIILLPYVSEHIAKHELESANHFINKLALSYLAFALILIAFLVLFINYLTTFFFSSSYLITTDISRIMVLSILPQALYLLYRNPIDAVSVIPYNTIVLGICLTTMVVSFMLCTSLSQLAWAYLLVSSLQGFLSMATWQSVKNRKIAA